MQNSKLAAGQIARFIEQYDSGDAAILLQLKLCYFDAFTGKEYFIEERSKVKKDRVDIL
jgi:hypothetical protein